MELNVTAMSVEEQEEKKAKNEIKSENTISNYASEFCDPLNDFDPDDLFPEEDGDDNSAGAESPGTRLRILFSSEEEDDMERRAAD